MMKQNFSSYQDAVDYVDTLPYNVVIKASGLAAGKGVILPTTKEEAKTALKEIMIDHIFGSSGRNSQS